MSDSKDAQFLAVARPDGHFYMVCYRDDQIAEAKNHVWTWATDPRLEFDVDDAETFCGRIDAMAEARR